MRLLLFFITFLSVATAECATITKADEITYEFLVQTGEQTGFCDHIGVFKKIFETMKVKTLLEFGLGYSTKYFLDNCTKVISVEFVTNGGWGPEWIKKCLELYKGYSNWVPVAYFTSYRGDYSWAPYKYFGTELLLKAENYHASMHLSYSTIDPTYLNELQTFISNLAKYNKIDVALIDPGSTLRGELVQLMFGKVPVILTHDSTTSKLGLGFDPYGFSRVKVPEDYEEIHIFKGKGTTVWIKKDEAYTKLSEVLKDYAK